MHLNHEILKDIVRVRISRAIIYLQQFVKEIPKYLLKIRHKFEHPISELHILIQQLIPPIKLKNLPSFPFPEGGIADDINYFDFALNELKTALQYFKLREPGEVFTEIQDYYLEQKLAKIVGELEGLKQSLT